MFLFRTSILFNALDNLCGLGSLVFMGGSRGLPMNLMVSTKDENIGNHGYIGTSILRIYRIYIGGYSGKKYR